MTGSLNIAEELDREDEIEQLVEEGMDRGHAAALTDARAGRVPAGCDDETAAAVATEPGSAAVISAEELADASEVLGE